MTGGVPKPDMVSDREFFEPSTGKAYLELDVPFQVARTAMVVDSDQVRVGMYLHLFFPRCSTTVTIQ